MKYQKISSNHIFKTSSKKETKYKQLHILNYQRNEVKKFLKNIDINNGICILEQNENSNILMVYSEFEKKYKNYEIIEYNDNINIDSILEIAKKRILLLTISTDIKNFKNKLKEKIDKEKYFKLFNDLFLLMTV